jgi:UDP-glucose 4-epimerase
VKLIVVGCRGFLGGVIGRRASQQGHDVVGIGTASQPDARWIGRYVQADVATTSIAALIENSSPDAIIYAAGTASVGASLRDPLQDFRASVLPWAGVLDSIRRSNRSPLVLFLSSAAVYGEPSSLPIPEGAAARPISPYGFHKLACETLAQEFASCFGARVAALRLFSVYGPAQRRLLLWELFNKPADDGQPVLRLEGTGEESRDYLHQDDVADVVLRLAARLADVRAGTSLSINVASGSETRVLDLARLLVGAVRPATIEPSPIARPGDPLRWQADITALRQWLPDWSPRPLHEGILACVEAWRHDRA